MLLCVIEGCVEDRAPAPKNPKYKQSKYCPTHKAEAGASFRAMIGASKDVAVARDAKFAEAWDKAEAAGLAAGQGASVVPMRVVQREFPLDNGSKVVLKFNI